LIPIYDEPAGPYKVEVNKIRGPVMSGLKEHLRIKVKVSVVCDREFTKSGREYGCVADHAFQPIDEKTFNDSREETLNFMIGVLEKDGWKVIDGKLHCPECADIVENGERDD
jgi:hypothetical protein